MHVILGAGAAGISAGYHCKLRGVESVVFERGDTWGGLCDSFQVGGFRFDHGPHLSFTKDPYVQGLFASSADFTAYTPDILNYYQGLWVRHPAQSNLFPLSVEEKVKIIADFARRTPLAEPARDYEEWLRAQYGDYFAEHFPLRYTRKYWATEAREMTVDWIGQRMQPVTLEDVLRGALSAETGYGYYAGEMRYPKAGGYRSFLSGMAGACDIRFRKEAVRIDHRKRQVRFADGERVEYRHLISSLPLPEVVSLMDGVPARIKDACARLVWSSVALVSLGFNSISAPSGIFAYVYDEDILPSRFHSPSRKSASNAPAGKASLQFETYFSSLRPLQVPLDHLTEHVVDRGKKMGLFDPNQIVASDCRVMKYAGVIFNRDRAEARATVMNYLESCDIKSVGRFGSWDYLWSDQSVLSGKAAVEECRRNEVGP